MAISDPPERVNNTQTHGSDTRQQSAGRSDQQGDTEAKRQRSDRQKQRGQKSIQPRANNGNREHRQTQAEQPADQGDHQRLRQNKKEHEAARESNGLQHREFARTFTNGNRHGIAGDQQQSEKDHTADGQDQEFDVPQLFGKTRLERRFGFGLGFRGGVCKSRIDRFGDAHGVIRVIEFQDVPADRTFYNRRKVFVEVFPLEPELALVTTRGVVRVNRIEVELARFRGAI